MNNPKAINFAEATRQLLNVHGNEALTLAKTSIHHSLESEKAFNLDLDNVSQKLKSNGASFVTLNASGRLRGCIGSVEAWRPLATDIVANANQAAFHDPRFASLKSAETPGLDVHISVLSPSEPFVFTDEADFLAKLNVGVDGLIIEDLNRRAVFLPSVWSQLPTPHQFLNHLKAKAGLSQNHWSATFKAWRFIAAETGAKWDDISI